jgi:uncharacterized membrane protein
LLIVAYTLFFSLVTLRKHAAFQTTAFDLGNMDQAVWNSLFGRPLAYTNWDTEGTRLGYHVDPILVLISPLYLLHSGPETLLVFQSLFLALGALPLFALSRRAFLRVTEPADERLRPPHPADVAALTFALVYLLFPALEAANLFDFHPTTLEAPLIAFALFFVETERYRALFVTALLIMACKEDATLVVIALGIYTLLRDLWHRRGGRPFTVRRASVAGLALIIVGAVWFVTAVYVIIPHFNAGGKSPYLGAYRELGKGPAEILRTLLTNPAKVAGVVLVPAKIGYLRDLFTPVLFTSLLAPLALLPAFPTLTLNLLSHNLPFYTLEKFHYAAPLVPTVVASAAYGTAFLARRLRARGVAPRKAVYGLSSAVLVATLLYHGGHGFTPLGLRFRWYEITPHARLAEQFVRLIPPDVPVSAQTRLNPHLSNRRLIYMFPKIADAEYVLFDASADSWPVHPNDVRRIFDELIAGDYGILAARDGFVLLKRGEPNKTLPDAFYDFVRGDDPRWRAEARFGDRLRLRGFDVRQDEAGRTSLATYWQIDRPLATKLRIYPFFYDGRTTQITEDTEQRPLVGLLWYPTNLWKPGETVRLETLPWTVEPNSLIGVGVIEGNDWWRDRRLPADVITGTAVLRPAFNDTAVQLARLRDGHPVVDERLFRWPTAPRRKTAVRFGQVAALAGYELSCSPVCTHADRLALRLPSNGEASLSTTLFWRALSRPEVSYTVFVHLLGPDGRLVSQHDGLPVNGARTTDTWLPHETLVDTVTIPIPATLPAGTYRIELGLYDATTGVRVPAFDGEGKRLEQDRFLLPTLLRAGAG